MVKYAKRNPDFFSAPPVSKGDKTTNLKTRQAATKPGNRKSPMRLNIHTIITYAVFTQAEKYK
jgi:hypothetical protein